MQQGLDFFSRLADCRAWTRGLVEQTLVLLGFILLLSLYQHLDVIVQLLHSRLGLCQLVGLLIMFALVLLELLLLQHQALALLFELLLQCGVLLLELCDLLVVFSQLLDL